MHPLSLKLHDYEMEIIETIMSLMWGFNNIRYEISFAQVQ